MISTKWYWLLVSIARTRARTQYCFIIIVVVVVVILGEFTFLRNVHERQKRKHTQRISEK